MNRTFLSRTPLYDRDDGSAPARATTRITGQRFTLADASPTVPEQRDRIALWVNEGGAGGEVSR
jgi:hypothetical protein